MSARLRVLLVEDSPDDAELIVRRLEDEGFVFDAERVETERAFLAELERQPDLILADWTLPSFSGLRALMLMKEKGLDTPFVLVTGSIGEEAAADALLRGAYDCVIKDRLARLGLSVRNALENKRLRTERVQQEEQLRKLTRAVEQSPVSVIITDAEGRIEYVNPKFSEVTGYSQEEVLGRNPRILKSGEWPAEKYRELWAALTQGREWHGEFLNRRKDGTLFRERATICPLRDSAGATTHYLAVKEDITATKYLEEQLRHASRMESVGMLAGGVAHDFNNLLTVINGYCELILQDIPPDDGNKPRVMEVLSAGQRAAALTRQLLAFSRKQLIETRPTNVNDVVSATCMMIQRVIGEDVRLELELEPALGWVMADRGQLDQVILNLAVNARDAMPRGGTLRMRTANAVLDEEFASRRLEVKPGEYVLLEVGDNGAGMDNEVRLRVFEPFFTTKAEKGGTGLGLSTAYGIVHQCEGWIEVESLPGEGSTFRIYLPRLPEERLPGESLSVEDGQAGGRGETILVVEDQEEVLKLTVQALRGFGYVVLPANGAEAALKLAAEYRRPIDLILTDVIMPGLNGRELARELVLRRPEARVLYMSGYPADVIASDGVLEPGVNFIAKPFSTRALAQKILAVLAGPSTNRKVLVVDDEEGIRNLFRATLERGGYEVQLAADGEEALEVLGSQVFDLVILDLVMPNREGIETIQTIHRRFPKLKIVAVSGAFGGKFLAAAKLLGADATVLKPVSPDELLRSVGAVLG